MRHAELLTPADIEARYRMPGGHWHHGELQADQMLMSRPVSGAAGYDTPIDGLFLCGAGSHPGGGVPGVPGSIARAADHLAIEGAERMARTAQVQARSRLSIELESASARTRRAQAHFRTLRLASPFQPRLDALTKTEEWYNWAGYRAPNSLWDEELEYFAIRSQAALFDISPMVKYRIEGPDAEAFLNRVTLRDVAKLKPGRVHYTAWCDDEGHVLDDGTLFRLAETRFRLCCQERHLPWLLDSAVGFDVAVAEETEAVAGLALQGPTSFAVLRAAGFAGVERLKLFDLAEFPHEGGTVTISRTGFTGDLGYELFVAGRAGAVAVGPAVARPARSTASAPSAITR